MAYLNVNNYALYRAFKYVILPAKLLFCITVLLIF